MVGAEVLLPSGNNITPVTVADGPRGNNEYDPNERLNRTIKSSGKFQTEWKSVSFTAAASQNWNLDTDSKTEILPSFIVSKSNFQLFPDPEKSKPKQRYKPWEEPEEVVKRFYHNINISFNSTGKNFRNRTLVTSDSSYFWKNHQTVLTRATISSPQKFFGFLCQISLR